MARPSKPWYRASKGAWYVKVNGRQVGLGVRGEDNEKAAVDAWHKLMAGGVAHRPQITEPTTAEIIQAFLDDSRGRVKAETWKWYSRWLLPFSTSHGKLPASDLTPTVAENYARRPNWSMTTRSHCLGVLTTAFRWAERSRLIRANPLRGLQSPPRASRAADALISPEQHAKLLEHSPPPFRLFLQVLWATGARPGEVAAITAENFDPVNGLVRLKHHKTSHRGHERVIHLPPEVVALLAEQLRLYRTGHLLRNRYGRHWQDEAFGTAMRTACKRAGVPRRHCYGYRHTFATDALVNGVGEAHVAQLLGHAGTRMLHQHYAHLGAKARALKEALSRVRGGEQQAG